MCRIFTKYTRHFEGEKRLLHFADGFNAEIKIDMDPDEPDYIEKNGETVANKNNRIKSMNRDELKAHIRTMFEKHYAWKARHAGLEGGSAESVTNGLMSSLLEDIAADVFENPEYQRGVANYHHIYQQAWDSYLDFVNESGNTDDPMWNNIAYMKKAPGCYGKGGLVRIPQMYSGRRRGRSEYAKQWLRAKAGVNVDPQREYARKKAADIRGGYGRVWARNVEKRLWKDPDFAVLPEAQRQERINAEVEAIVRNRLGPQLTRAYDRPDLPPPPPVPEKEIIRRGHSIAGNIDVEHRSAAGREINRTYGTTARSEKAMDKQYTFTERRRGDEEAGYSHVVEVYKEGKKARDEYVEGFEPERGVLIIEPNADNPSESLTSLIDYRTADKIIATIQGPPPPTEYYKDLLDPITGFFSIGMQEEVFTQKPIEGREHEYYSSDKMVMLYTRIYPKLQMVIGAMKGMKLDPNEVKRAYEGGDERYGVDIAANMNAHPELMNTWQNLLLTYSGSPTGNTRELFTTLGIIPKTT